MSASNLQTPPQSPTTKVPQPGRVMVLCFDGTGNKFGENSNVVRFFRALRKDLRHEQVLYYQPGIGTYQTRSPIIFGHARRAWSALDSAIARGLDDHVKEGYQFIIQNYQDGDRICLFGFSRGAHTARVVAGMLYKVGILPKENVQQVDFALSVYSDTGFKGYSLSQDFKYTFTGKHKEFPKPAVDFVGVWDTVSSVGLVPGIFPRMHPYTSVEYSVRTFRHALALDERRARFRPSVWNELAPEQEQDIDVDIPVPECDRKVGEWDDWNYTPPMRDYADVKEVWFAGCHGDVGGGSHEATRKTSLSLIPLRWMIKECILCKSGIRFDLEYLETQIKFNISELKKEIVDHRIQPSELGASYQDIVDYLVKRNPPKEDENKPVTKQQSGDENKPVTKQQSGDENKPVTKQQSGDGNKPVTNLHSGQRSHDYSLLQHLRDVRDNVFDQLRSFPLWWGLEYIPTFYSFQDGEGNWIRCRISNRGRGRFIPFSKDEMILVHKSVETRIERVKINGKAYKPKALYWDKIYEGGLIEWVQ